MNASIVELELELERAIQSDDRYKRVDNMKKKAILTAESYDQFRGLVACAKDDLRPLSKEERERGLDGIAGSVKTRINKGVGEAIVAANIIIETKPETTIKKVPRKASSFDRLWRTIDVPTRFELLTKIKSKHYSRIFQRELEFSLTTEIFEALEKGEIDESNSEKIIGLLKFISENNGRLSLNVAFMSNEEKEMVQRAFTKLKGVCSDTEIVDQVKKAFSP
eukprot:TRINITY_DN781916_c0_g1_i1.p1 TRINITY_DN781916_c0_g1~~TRINITY_DN781916_c0_g1_i1.p1  ORF type:complete len:222 (+),score=34.72 TRINITY_DN781916_c0_g1_i1:44-709(+)